MEAIKFRHGLTSIVSVGIMFFGCLVGEVKAAGKLEILNNLNNISYQNYIHATTHYDGASEEPDDSFDRDYSPRNWGVHTEGSKLVSIIEPAELRVDVRPEESFTPVNLEASLDGEN